MTLPGTGDPLLLLHNPGCSKSRATLTLLEEKGARFRVREYLEDPLSREELESLAARLGRSASGFVRGKESAFAESGCDADSNDAAILDAMAAAPILMERPILVRADRAVIGRPPEDVLVLLSSSSRDRL